MKALTHSHIVLRMICCKIISIHQNLSFNSRTVIERVVYDYEHFSRISTIGARKRKSFKE